MLKSRFASAANGERSASRSMQHTPIVFAVVVYPVVHRASVVPDRQIAARPRMPVGEVWFSATLIQHVEQRRALLVVPALNTAHERRVDIERLKASGMGMYYGMGDLVSIRRFSF